MVPDPPRATAPWAADHQVVECGEKGRAGAEEEEGLEERGEGERAWAGV